MSVEIRVSENFISVHFNHRKLSEKRLNEMRQDAAAFGLGRELSREEIEAINSPQFNFYDREGSIYVHTTVSQLIYERYGAERGNHAWLHYPVEAKESKMKDYAIVRFYGSSVGLRRSEVVAKYTLNHS